MPNTYHKIWRFRFFFCTFASYKRNKHEFTTQLIQIIKTKYNVSRKFRQ